MAMRRFVPIAILLIWLSAATACQAQGDWDKVFGNFVVVWSDGDVTAGKDFTNWRMSREEADALNANHTLDKGKSILDAGFGGRPMFSDANRFARILHNTSVKPVRPGPLVEMRGGDILPGLLTEGPVERRGRDRGEPDMFVTVVASGQLAPEGGDGQVYIRADSVARVAFVDRSHREITPGLVVYRDGREVTAKSIKWEIDGIRLLLADSVAKTPWAELAEVHFPHPSEAEAAEKPTVSNKLRLFCRLVTTGGAVATYPVDTSRRRLYASHHNIHYIRPSWSDHELHVPLVTMVSQSYFRADEVPLSSLPTTTLVEENITGFTWRWRRNQNVRGAQLAVGPMVAALGIGMHSHCEVAFDLPDGAVSFASWVGLDEAVGRGGCVRCKVYLDEVAGQPAWSSDLLRGSDAPVAVSVPNLRDAKRLILVAEYADEGHPADADPLDLRDEVDWLFPFVTVR